MFNTFLRLFVYFFSKIFKTDEISDKYPVSLKAIIIDDNRVLCLKNERNEWDFPGGKLNFNESVEECLIREVKEETNLYISNTEIVSSLNLKFNHVPVFVVVFSAKISCDSPIIASYEHLEFNFFSKAEIDNLNMPNEYKMLIDDLLKPF